MTLTKDDLTGIYTALVTPFDQEGAVDTGAAKRLVEHCVVNGTAGLVPNGGTGEYAAMTASERARRSVNARSG